MKHRFFQYIKKSFSVRLILLFVGITVCSALALNYYFYTETKKDLHEQLIKHGKSLTRMLVDSSRLGVFTGSKQDLFGPVQTIFEDDQCKKVVIYDWEGTAIIAMGDDEGPEKGVFSSRAMYEKVSKIEGPATVLSLKEDEIVFGQPVFSGKTYSEDELFIFADAPDLDLAPDNRQPPIGYVAILLSTEKMAEKIHKTLLHNSIATLAVIMVSSLCILLLLRRMTKPLKTLSKEIVKHKYEVDEDGAEDEIIGDFSSMIDIIQESYRTLTDLKNNLEEKVAIRTQDLANQKITLLRANSSLAEAFAQLQKAQQQIVQTEKMASLGLMISGLSHEIKNSINFISSSLPLLRHNLHEELNGENTKSNDGKKRRDNIEKLLSNINEGVQRTVSVIEDLANFSYESPNDFQNCDALPGLKSAVGILKREYKNRIAFYEEYACEHLVVWGSTGQISQVCMNLLLNATQAIEQNKGSIYIRAWQKNGKAYISIKDTGKGISPENQRKIFDPFFTTKDVGQGSGLGLSISYSIIKKHDGEIKVESEEGAGSEFTIILPLKSSA